MRIFYVVVLSLLFIGCGADDPAVDGTGNTPAPVEGGETDTARLVAAQNLYKNTCGRAANNNNGSCHVDSSATTTNPNKRGATVSRITTAITNNTGGMGFLSDLSKADIDEIVYALAN